MAPNPAEGSIQKEPKRSRSAPAARGKKAAAKPTDVTPHNPSHAQQQIAKKRQHTAALFDNVEDLDMPGSTAAAMGVDPVPRAGEGRRKKKKDQLNPNSAPTATALPTQLPQGPRPEQQDKDNNQHDDQAWQEDQQWDEFEDIQLFDVHSNSLVAYMEFQTDDVSVAGLREKFEARTDLIPIPRPKWTPIRIDTT